MNDKLKPYTRKVWLAVAIVTATIIFLGAFTYLLSGLLIIFAGILFGVEKGAWKRGHSTPVRHNICAYLF